jgi:crossover junction endodeoxyribonuclease RuvC
MRILGIDPGIARTGWGVIDEEKGKVTVVEFGCITTSQDMEVSQRLLILKKEIEEITEKFNPDVLSIEELFFNTNAKTALIVGQARGVILVSGAEKSLPIHVYTPLQVKMALTGYGRAEKNQVGEMVKILLKLSTIPKPDDTADALAIALTHAFSRKGRAFSTR